MLESLPKDPLFWACALVAVGGVVVHYLYSGFLKQNYREIVWFRRILLPHMSLFLEKVDDDLEGYDLSKFYVETEMSDKEHVMDIEVGRSEYEEVHDELAQFLFERHFRPEVLLASLSSSPRGYKEIGNYVLTAPEKKHSKVPFLGKMYDVLILLMADWQLHVRVFYDSENDRLRIYVHREKNPYNPIEAKNHYRGNKMDYEGGRKLFRRYVPDLEKEALSDQDYEVVYE